MHSLVLVAGEDVARQLEPFADYLEVAPYRVFVEDDDREAMAEHFGLPADDLDALAAKMPQWNEVEGEVHDGRLAFWSTSNPRARFDWYKVGGRFAGYLRLAEPRKPSWLRRALGGKPTECVDCALKREVAAAPVLAEPPAALVRDGKWVEQGWGDEAPSDEEWQTRFSELFAAIPDDQRLTVVDAHF